MAKTRIAPAVAIRRLDAHFMSAAATKDAKALVNGFYVPTAVLMPPNNPIVKRRANIQKFLQGLLDAGATNVTLRTTTIESADDLAYGRGAYRFTLPGPDGASAEEIGKYVVVYRRQRNGSWLAVADIFNSDQPAAS